MERARRDTFESAGRRPAAEPELRSAAEAASGAAGRTDHALVQAMRSGPAMTAQRQVLQGVFGDRTRLAPVANSAVAQRYVEAQGGKLSAGGNLFLAGDGELYAGETQFQQANGISGGQVAFAPGAGRQVNQKQLAMVKPVVREGSDLDKALSRYDPKDETEHVQRDAKLRYQRLLAEAVVEEAKPQWRRLRKEDPAQAEREFGPCRTGDEFEDMVDGWAEIAAEFTFRHTTMGAELEAYLQKQGGARPNFPHDCRAMAQYVAGFDAGSAGVVTDQVAAGNVYKLTSENPRTEWDFHYATIIMTDGPDHATLENAATKKSQKFSKLQYDQGWFFAMYGPQQGQSIADAYRRDMDPDAE